MVSLSSMISRFVEFVHSLHSFLMSVIPVGKTTPFDRLRLDLAEDTVLCCQEDRSLTETRFIRNVTVLIFVK